MIEPIERTKLVFHSGGTACIGYLYRPASAHDKLPCLVMGTGFGGTQDTPSIIAGAQSFASAGFAALTFDYRSFGESEGTPRQVVQIKGQLEDFHAAVQFARSQPGIDPDRVALWGTSLGGGHIISVAAADSRIAAVVSQIPFNGFPKKVEGRSAELTRSLLGAMIKDTVQGWFGRSPHYIPAVGNSDELAVMSSIQAKKVIEGMESKTWRNEVAPRALFEMMRYKPGKVAASLKMPLLVCIGEYDKETLGDVTSQLAKDAPHGELISYPAAHFDFYNPELRQRVISDQIAFLQKHLVRAQTTASILM